jgi:hypothetical protein
VRKRKKELDKKRLGYKERLKKKKLELKQQKKR